MEICGIEEAIEYLKENLKNWKADRPDLGNSDIVEEVDKDYKAIETLLTAYEKEKEENVKLRLQDIPLIEGELKAYKDRVKESKQEFEKEKEKNKRAEELYMQHNQMIIDILKECDYMIKNRYYMNDIAIRQYAEKIKDIVKYYIKEPEWIEIEEE